MTACLAIAVTALLLAGCSSEAPESKENQTPTEASTPLEGSTSMPTLGEAAVISECSAAIQERDFSEGGATFEEGYPTHLALTSIRDGEWFIVFRPAVATGQADYYCVSDGDTVAPMNRDQYTESVS